MDTSPQHSQISFEMDCKTVVDNMVVNFKGSTTFHVLSQNCRANLATMLNSRVSFLKRQVNHVAHKGLQDSMLALIFLIISLHVSFPTLWMKWYNYSSSKKTQSNKCELWKNEAMNIKNWSIIFVRVKEFKIFF